MKKITLTAMAVLALGISASAANPFSDVTPNDWAYQAVVDLSGRYLPRRKKHHPFRNGTDHCTHAGQ